MIKLQSVSYVPNKRLLPDAQPSQNKAPNVPEPPVSTPTCAFNTPNPPTVYKSKLSTLIPNAGQGLYTTKTIKKGQKVASYGGNQLGARVCIGPPEQADQLDLGQMPAVATNMAKGLLRRRYDEPGSQFPWTEIKKVLILQLGCFAKASSNASTMPSSQASLSP